MRRIIFVFLLCVTLFLIGWGEVCARAESKSLEEVEEQIGEEVEKYADSLDLGEFEEFVGKLDAPSEFSGMSTREILNKLVKGEIPFRAESLFSFFGQKALGALTGTLAALLTVVIIAVMNSILSGLTSGFVKKQSIEIVHFVCFALVVSVVMAKVAGIVRDCKVFCDGVNKLTETTFPPLITLISALGGGVSSSVYKPQLALFAVIISNLFVKVILPLFLAAIAFCFIGNLSSSIKMDKIQSAIRYASNLIVTCVFGLFMTYLTIAGITGGMVDGVGIKAAKFVLSGYVPILGGYLSQGFDLISAGCVLIKNAIGMIGILAVLFLIAKPILEVTVFSLALKIVASVIQPIGDKRISDFLYSISNATKILVTAIVGIGFVLIVTLLLIVGTCNAGVL